MSDTNGYNGQQSGAYAQNPYAAPPLGGAQGYGQAYGAQQQGYAAAEAYAQPQQGYVYGAQPWQGYAGDGVQPVVKGEDYTPLTTGKYLLMELVLFIPVINIIMMIVWSTGGEGANVHRRSYARAKLIWCLIYTVMVVLIVVLTLHVFAQSLGFTGISEFWSGIWVLFDTMRAANSYGGQFEDYFGGGLEDYFRGDLDGLEDFFRQFGGDLGGLEDYFRQYGGGLEDYFRGDLDGLEDFFRQFGGELPFGGVSRYIEYA